VWDSADQIALSIKRFWKAIWSLTLSSRSVFSWVRVAEKRCAKGNRCRPVGRQGLLIPRAGNQLLRPRAGSVSIYACFDGTAIRGKAARKSMRRLLGAFLEAAEPIGWRSVQESSSLVLRTERALCVITPCSKAHPLLCAWAWREPCQALSRIYRPQRIRIVQLQRCRVLQPGRWRTLH
jgi:hypothetical protein